MSAPHSATVENKTPNSRDVWLAALVAELRGWFTQHGVHLPAVVHITSGWGHASGRRHAEAPGIQAHLVSGAATRHGAPVIYVSPVVDDPLRIAVHVVHQLVHAAFDPDMMGTHPAPFRQAARAVDLAGKPTAPELGPELREVITEFLAGVGDYPAEPVGSLVLPVIEGRTTTAPPVQSDRYTAARCPSCPGHRTKHRTVKLSRRAAEEGAPICGRILSPATDTAPAVRCMEIMLLDEEATAR